MNGAAAATPGQKAAGRSAPPPSSSGPSVKEALSALQAHAGESDDPTKAQAAIKTLRTLFDAAGPDAQDKASTPGRQAAQRSGGDSFTGAASQAAQRFGGRR